MIDERYQCTAQERQQIVETFFDESGKLTQLPRKEKRKIIILGAMVEKFDCQKNYSEKVANASLKTVVEDYVTVRRYLIEYGFMKRQYLSKNRMNTG